MSGPWEKYQQPQGGVFTLPQNPQQARAEKRQQEKDAKDQAHQDQQDRIARARLQADLDEKGLMLDGQGNVVPKANATAPGNSTLTGEAYLRTLPPSMQNEVRMLSDGRMAFPTGAALRNPKMQQLVAAAAQYDPTLDAANSRTRQATRIDFTSGKSRNNITAMNTAIGHLGTLSEAAKGLDNGNWQIVNSTRNSISTQFGDPRVVKFNMARDAVANELTRVFRGAGGAEADVQGWKATINSAQSPEQLQAAILQGRDLLNSRLNAVGQQYDAGMGKSSDPIMLLSPHAQEVYNNLGGPLGGGGNNPENPFGGFPSASGGEPGLYDANGNFIGQNPDQTSSDPFANAPKVYGPEGPSGGYTQSYVDANGEEQTQIVGGGATPVNPYEQRLQRMLDAQGFNPNDVNSYKDRFVQGASMNMADELGGGTGGALSYLFHGKNPITGYQVGRDAERMKQHQMQQSQGMLGNVTELAGSLPTAFAIPGSAGGGVRGAMKAGAGFGLLDGYGRGSGLGGSTLSALGGAAGGLVGGGIGGAGGKYIAAPLARRALNTDAGRALASRFTGGRFEPVPNPTPFEGAMGKVDPNIDNVRANLTQAQDLGVPYSLADADPRLRLLAGKVSRSTPDARAMAENYLEPRSMGQIDRLRGAVDQHLAPITNVEQRGGELMQAGNIASSPLYTLAKGAPAPVDDELAAMLQSPAGRDALTRAKEIAANEGRDPNAMGFGMDMQGNITIERAPSFETLDLVKRGLDSRLNEARNPITGQLDLSGNPLLQSVEGFRKGLVGKLDRMNPHYPQARAKYAEFAGMKSALDRGYKAPGMLPREADAALGNLKPRELPEFQRGAATSIADRAEKMRFTADPWAGTYGSPAQQARIGSIFPEGAPAFGNHYGLERDMAKTTMEALGGSQTAARQSIDQALGSSMLEHSANIGGMAATGAPALGTAAKAGLGFFARRGIDKAARGKADLLAPLLFNDADKVGVLGLLDQMAANSGKRTNAANKAARRAGLFGAAIGG